MISIGAFSPAKRRASPWRRGALWKLSGPDATRYLNGQVTNDVALLADGRAFYAAVCTAKGRMEGDLSIARHDADYYLDAEAALREGLGARLDKFLIADDAVFEDITDEWSVTHHFGATPPAAPSGGFIIAYARYGLPGHDVWTFATTPAPAGPVADAELVETLRLEHGLPRWGAELTPTTPAAGGLARRCSPPSATRRAATSARKPSRGSRASATSTARSSSCGPPRATSRRPARRCCMRDARSASSPAAASRRGWKAASHSATCSVRSPPTAPGCRPVAWS
ncbi:MAG: hypothetical protein WDO13_11025 [Verrucomicrobiota bacterium]